MRHPLTIFTSPQQKRIFLISLGFTVLLLAIMSMINAPLNTPQAPFGIISFELSGNLPKAQAILNSWDDLTRQKAAFGLGLDFVFMLLYSTLIGLGCLWASRVLEHLKWPFSQAGQGLAWAQILAAVFDGIENTGLTIILFGSTNSIWLIIARWSAIIKFSLIFIGMVYSFLGATAYLTNRREFRET